MLGLRSVNDKQNHILCNTSYILIEDRVRGLLFGLWENPHYSENWQEAVAKASDAASLKPLLLSLESNLQRIALSIDWSKPVDYPCAVGSGSILMSTPGRTSSNFVASRKLAKIIISGDGFSLIPMLLNRPIFIGGEVENFHKCFSGRSCLDCWPLRVLDKVDVERS